jgi:hypothetical protein
VDTYILSLSATKNDLEEIINTYQGLLDSELYNGNKQKEVVETYIKQAKTRLLLGMYNTEEKTE